MDKQSMLNTENEIEADALRLLSKKRRKVVSAARVGPTMGHSEKKHSAASKAREIHLISDRDVTYTSKFRNDAVVAIRKGFPPRAVGSIKKALDMTDRDIAAALGISEKTIQRKRRKEEKFSLVESDRLYRLAHLFALAARVLGSNEAAQQWLNAPQYELAGEVPLEAMKTEVGAREVEEILNRIKFGVIA